MSKIAEEFKKFVLRGNVMDMAVGVLIGGAFTGIVTALTTDFINPIIASFGGAEIAGHIKLPWVDYTQFETVEEAQALQLNYGDFISSIINFLILAIILFILMKSVNALMEASKKKKKKEEEAPAAPTTKMCPFCKTEVHIEATRCPHCTSEIPAEEKK